ncbi:SVM family protein [Candidatus Phytoplasma tritici]|uniref:SVM family protein n=1 Tax=Candidatus Phytoplasma tritici TaxID=321961 RepID=UPI00040FC1A0|nr:SVM family protein [Candidatus Phytoplasma tritici]
MINSNILEADQEMYEGMLSNAIKLRDSLQCQYDKSEKEYQNQIILKYICFFLGLFLIINNKSVMAMENNAYKGKQKKIIIS